MKISKKVQDAFNSQIKNEFDSAYLYLSMAAYFKANNFDGFAHWMEKQSDEEVEHGMKFFNHIIERGGNVTLLALDKPKATWKSLLEAFQDAYNHELKVTQMIHSLKELAKKEGDHAAKSFLKWFVDEQVEEEANADRIVQQLKMIGTNNAALFMLDKELGQRK